MNRNIKNSKVKKMEAPQRKTKDYSKSELIFGNLAIVLWILLGAYSCYLLYPLSAIGFVALASFLVFFELGKHGCQTCYLCKTCTIGIGKLPELFFRKAGTANVKKKAMKLFPFVYLLLSLVPIVLYVVSITQTITILKILTLAPLLSFSIYSGVIRKKAIL
jgi:hypothetical protein